jgi:hypothetical protein
MRSRALTVLVAMVLALGAAACRGRTRAPDAEPDEPGRFAHAAHPLPCTDCHDARAVAAGEARPPGGADHAPCDRGQCHREAFLTDPGTLCKVCHTAVEPGATGTSPLVAYPRTEPWRSLPSRFSHAVHADTARMDAAVGFHVACSDCHPGGDTEWPKSPGHAECARCHADEVGLPDAPPLSACAECHQTGRATRHVRRLVRGDLQFDHRRHLADSRGQRIRCETCHQGTRTAADRISDEPPVIAVCVACHDDEQRVPPQRNMRQCATCHSGRSENLGTLAPRSHLPATERPANHTLAFRRDHAEIAGRDAARCASCHTQLSGSPEAACDECHQAQRPQDHTVGFREVDHGSDSLAEPERCTTCHVVDFCTACHSQPPRSHQPLLTFRIREHGDLARVEPRACIVCHDPQRDCGPCHENAGDLR